MKRRTIVAAMVFGAWLGKFKLGFMGINPSVTLPEWLTGTRQTVVHYARGLTAGAALLLFYLLYWMRKYRRNPTFSREGDDKHVISSR